MTTINAMRFNDQMGCMICDEQRGWNDENLKILSADKIKPIISDPIRDRYGLVACYGNTGTSSWGDELKFEIRRAVDAWYEEESRRRGGTPPGQPLTIEQIAARGFEVLTRMKHDHIDQTLRGRYGFTARDFIRGFYEKDGKKVEIKDSEIVSEVDGNLIWKGRTGEMTPVFLNAGILAGWDPLEGFRIFALSLIEFKAEPVQEAFLCDGSGRDMATVRLTEYLNMRTVPERRGAIDPVEGLVAAIDAVNAAVRLDIGCYGYFNIILFDGKEQDPRRKMRQHDGHESKLATEIVSAGYYGLVSRDVVHELVEALLYKDAAFEEIQERFFSAAGDVKRLRRFLRGYKVV
jgi:hypothetical protein